VLTSHTLLVPHLPTLLVDQHRHHRTEMLEALEHAAEKFQSEIPVTAVVLSARWEASGPFFVDPARRHDTITDYIGFGVEVRDDCVGDPPLARALVEAGRKAKVRVGPAQRGVDSGVSVPMHFLAPRRDVAVVPLSVSRQSAAECRAWGRVIRETLAAARERVAFVVGGHLSSNEHAWMLRRDVPEARAFDERVLQALSRGDWDAIGSLDHALIEKSEPATGLRHLEILRGFLGDDARGELHCYEPGPGVGAALVEFPITERVEEPKSNP
jgi:4,5-DOPA dioxygenase extradiol